MVSWTFFQTILAFDKPIQIWPYKFTTHYQRGINRKTNVPILIINTDKMHKHNGVCSPLSWNAH